MSIPRKTTAKKTPARRNTRKPVLPENIPAATDLDLGTDDTNGATADQAPLSNETAQQNDVSLEDRLAEIEVIDLRNVPPADRMALFLTLEDLGYLNRSTLQPVMAVENTAIVGLFRADAVSLNHTNKLLVLSFWSEVKNSYAISHTDIRMQVAIDFSMPGPQNPDYMSFGDSHYVRVPVEVRDDVISALNLARQHGGQPK